METRRLLTFVQVVETASLSRAASILRLTQPAVSQQVAELERHFGAKLLIRSNRGVDPTAAGMRLYRHAQNVLQHLEIAQKDVGAAVAGIVRVGMIPTITDSMLVGFLQRVQTESPEIKLVVQEGSSDSIRQQVFNNAIDVGVGFTGSALGVKSLFLLSEHLYLTYNPGIFNGTVNRQTLSDLPLISPSERSSHRVILDEFFARLGTQPRIVAEIDSLLGVLVAVKAGFGVALLPRSTAAAAYGLRQQRVPNLQRGISVYMSQASEVLPGVHSVFEILTSLARDLVRRGERRGAALAEQPALEAS